LQAEAEVLKGASRLEDLSVWMMEKANTLRKAARHIVTRWLPEGRAIECDNFHLRKLCKDGSRGSHTEGQKDESRGLNDLFLS
jgi:hypothetical protein